jgi:hypothetical protein
MADTILPNPRIKNLTGQQFGRLKVVRYMKERGQPGKWLCQCDCGGTALVTGNGLRRKDKTPTRSCGCLHKELLSERMRTHGQGGAQINGKRNVTPEYRCWLGMVSRCTWPGSTGWDNYGGRGICVCKRWRRFEAFFEDMGSRPSPKHSLERKDNDGNYEPGNVVWATRTQQMRNTRYNRRFTFRGETLTLSEWAERTGWAIGLIRDRIDVLGWDVERALTEPPAVLTDRFITFGGITRSLGEWAVALGMQYRTLYHRLFVHKMPVEKALTIPVRPRSK